MERCTIWRFGGRDRPGRGQGAARYQTTRALECWQGREQQGVSAFGWLPDARTRLLSEHGVSVL